MCSPAFAEGYVEIGVGAASCVHEHFCGSSAQSLNRNVKTGEAAGSDSTLPYLAIDLVGPFPIFLSLVPVFPKDSVYCLILYITLMILYLFPWSHLPPQCLEHPPCLSVLDVSTNLDLTSVK